MFKPACLRSIARNIPRQQAFSGRAVCHRAISTGSRQRSIGSIATLAVKRNTTALTAAGLLGGFILYQLSTQPVVQAEATTSPAEDLKSKLSVQHVQVRLFLFLGLKNWSDIYFCCRSKTAGKTPEFMPGEIMCMSQPTQDHQERSLNIPSAAE